MEKLETNIADEMIALAVKYESRLDWNGEAFDLNECYLMPTLFVIRFLTA